jgi:predicted MFS family arabinose efflux permease
MGKSSGAGSPLATGAMFFGAGFGIASTFSRMPGIRDQLGVSPDQLAFALVFLGIGSRLGLPFAGRFVERYSSRTVSLVATAVFLGLSLHLPRSGSLSLATNCAGRQLQSAMHASSRGGKMSWLGRFLWTIRKVLASDRFCCLRIRPHTRGLSTSCI